MPYIFYVYYAIINVPYLIGAFRPEVGIIDCGVRLARPEWRVGLALARLLAGELATGLDWVERSENTTVRAKESTRA